MPGDFVAGAGTHEEEIIHGFFLYYLRRRIDAHLRELHEGHVRQSSVREMRLLQRLLRLRGYAGSGRAAIGGFRASGRERGSES